MNTKRWRLEGVVSLLLTPFHADGSIDWAGYDAYVDWQVAQRPTASLPSAAAAR